MLWADRDGNIGYQLVGQDPDAQGPAARPAEARLDRRVRVGRHDPVRRAAERHQPAGGVPRHRQQPHRRRRLPAPHHVGVDDRLPRAAHRGHAGRARAALGRGLRAHAARLLLVPGHRDRPPAVAAARRPRSARCARSSGSRAGTASCRPTRSPARSTRPSRSCSPSASPRRRSTTSRCSQRYLDKSGVGAVRGRLLAVALPRAPARAVGRGRRDAGSRPRSIRRAALGRGRARVARRRRSTCSSSASAATRQRWRWGRVHETSSSRTRSAAPTTLFRRIFNRSARGRRRRARPSPRPATCRRTRSRAPGGPSTGCSPTSAIPATLALAAHDRPVGPAGLEALRRHARQTG